MSHRFEHVEVIQHGAKEQMILATVYYSTLLHNYKVPKPCVFLKLTFSYFKSIQLTLQVWNMDSRKQ